MSHCMHAETFSVLHVNKPMFSRGSSADMLKNPSFSRVSSAHMLKPPSLSRVLGFGTCFLKIL